MSHPVLKDKPVTALRLLHPPQEEVHQAQLTLKHLGIFCPVLETKKTQQECSLLRIIDHQIAVFAWKCL